jgi:uroporphyrinogen-III synthase
MKTPLAGKRILVTRPRAQAERLAQRLRAAGAEALVFPTIEILDPADPRPAQAILRTLDRFDLAIFVSPNAVERGLAMLARPWPAGLRAAAIGSGTRAQLEERGFKDVIAPSGQADSEALLALPQLEGRRAIVIFRGEGGRAFLGVALRERGATVEYAECYRRAVPRNASPPPGPVDAVTVNSAEALENLCAMLGKPAATLFVPHPRVAEAASRMGLQAVVAGPGDGEMLERLVAYFSA